jgi:predicted homoserine dehydrogenase-like protein
MTYGLCENADVCYKEKLLPIGVAEGCILNKDIPKDQIITYNDVAIPGRRLIDALRKEQEIFFMKEI